jgi:hypothetical protein
MPDTAAGLASAFGRDVTQEITPLVDIEVTAVAKRLGISYSEAYRIADLGTVLAVPGAPTIGASAIVDTKNVTVAFSAPGSNGGANIDWYVATSTPGGYTAQGTTSPITVTANYVTATSYTWAVTAVNAKGTSAASANSTARTPNP